MGLCQMLTKGHSMYIGETEKLLILRSGGILVSSPHLALPIFPDSPPSPIDFSAVQGFFTFLLGRWTGWEEFLLEYLLEYNILPCEKSRSGNRGK